MFLVCKIFNEYKKFKTCLVKISPTGLQLIGKSYFVAINYAICCSYAWNVLCKFTLFHFGDDILQTNKQTGETLFSFLLQAKQW